MSLLEHSLWSFEEDGVDDARRGLRARAVKAAASICCDAPWGRTFFGTTFPLLRASLIAQLVKNPPTVQETPSSIPGLRRFAGAGIGYPLQYSWASLVAQLVKKLPAMQETWV